MTKALWMLIQKQSCSSCVIFVGSTFSSRCIRDLDAVEIFYRLVAEALHLYNNNKAFSPKQVGVG